MINPGPDPDPNPYPGLEIPVNKGIGRNDLMVVPDPNVQNPVYPTDYTFQSNFHINDGSNEYRLANILNQVNTINLWQDTSNTAYTDLGNNYIGVLCNAPDGQTQGVPKLYANQIYKEIDLTDYINNINIPVNITIDQINIGNINITGSGYRSSWTFYSSSSSFQTDNNKKEIVKIEKSTNYYIINYYINIPSSTTITINENTWVFYGNVYSSSWPLSLINNGNTIIQLYDNTDNDNVTGWAQINNGIFDFSGINWMMFN